MTAFLLFCGLLIPYVAASASVIPSQSKTVLTQQCWHETSLLSVNLQSSRYGTVEYAERIGHHEVSLPDLSNENAFHPWTHEPVCTEELESLNSKLCVYTNASFSNGRGISIFTTPRIAEQVAALPAFQDPVAMKKMDINTFSGAWYTEELPGRGVGMLSKENLQHGDRITAYTPAILAYLEQELSTIEREKFFRIAVNQLPGPIRKNFLQLATVYGDPRIRAQDVVKANTFEFHVGGHNHLAVFPEPSRLNHACSPNAQYYLDPNLLTHFVHATRPIAPGEEITITYTSPLDPTSDRQTHLSEGFFFTCSCQRCQSAERTDATLTEIGRIQKSLNDWSRSSKGSPKLAEQLLELYRIEGLEGFLDVPYGFAALAHNAVGNKKMAIKYAELAVEAILLKDGPWTENLAMWRGLLEDPVKHWSWRRRVR